MRSSKCNNLNAKIAGPMELKHFNDAWANQNDNETNDGQMMNFLTDLSFNFTSKKWENQIVKYDHKDLKLGCSPNRPKSVFQIFFSREHKGTRLILILSCRL